MVKSVTKFTANDAGARITAEEFAGAQLEPPFQYERVRGRLVVMSPAGPEHRNVSRPFRRELGACWGNHPDVVEDVDVEGWVTTSTETDRIPDICVYLQGAHTGETVPRRVPDLIFEFVSADRSDQERDYIDKRAEYHAIGVKEYVIVDRFKQAALVLTWANSDFTEARLQVTDEYTSPLLPGLSVRLSEAFER